MGASPADSESPMRVLFSTHSGTGHFHPLVPTARALEAHGHEVAFCVPETFQSFVQANGFRVFPAGISFDSLSPEKLKEHQRQISMRSVSPEQTEEHAAGMFIDTFARSKVPELQRVCESWKPELIVFDSMDFAPTLVGEKLGIPYASIQVGGGRMRMTDSPIFLRHLDALRAEMGLPSDPRGQALFRYLHLAFLPVSFFGGVLAPTAHHLKPELFDRSGTEALPAWVASLGERPVVYATLGTVFNKFNRPLAMIIEGLREEPVELIVTVGRDQDPEQFGPQPSNVHVERYIPQSLLLPRCDLAIMHGGYSSVQSALYAGLPSLVMALGADQPMNAEACVALGVSRLLDLASLTPEVIRQQVREMLTDGGYRERARGIQAEALALPGLERGVELLERVAREKRPV